MFRGNCGKQMEGTNNVLRACQVSKRSGKYGKSKQGIFQSSGLKYPLSHYSFAISASQSPALMNAYSKGIDWLLCINCSSIYTPFPAF